MSIEFQVLTDADRLALAKQQLTELEQQYYLNTLAYIGQGVLEDQSNAALGQRITALQSIVNDLEAKVAE